MTPPTPDTLTWCTQVLGPIRPNTARPIGDRVIRVEDHTGRPYVVKQHTDDTKHRREVHAYRHWVHALADRAPRLVAADPNRRAVIVTALPGQAVSAFETRRLPHELWQQAGRLLRRLHDTDPQTDTSNATDDLLARAHLRLTQARPLLDTAAHALIRSYLADLETLPPVPTGVCHLDYQPRNWLMDAHGTLRVLDFEHTRLDLHVRDLVRLQFRYWPHHPDGRGAFLDGYGRALTDTEHHILRCCAAIDVVTSLLRGAATGDSELLAHAHATLHRLTDRQRPTRLSGRQPPRDRTLEDRHSMTALPDIREALTAPDRIGSALARYRTRVYRFTDDPRHYVLAERLEERFIDRQPPRAPTMDYVRHCLADVRDHGRVPDFAPAIAAAEGIDLDDELARRRPHAYQRHLTGDGPDLVLIVLGAPRSGTSHLVNLLAATGHFAYLTTASCWAWPTRNLIHPSRKLFTELGDAVKDQVLAVDNKRTRLIPALVMPGEAEDVHARAIPAYRHIAGHRYELHEPRLGQIAVGDTDVLHAAAAAHLRFFGRRMLLTKSPFHSLRIPAFENIWGARARYIHVLRDQHKAAEAIRRNRFEYRHDGRDLNAEETWTLLTDTVERHAPADRLATVQHQELLHQPAAVIGRLTAWAGIPAGPAIPRLSDDDL